MKVMRMLFQQQVNKAHKVMLMTFDNHVVGLGKFEWEMFPSLRVHLLNLIGETMKNNGNSNDWSFDSRNGGCAS
jgi:hypothetical protein